MITYQYTSKSKRIGGVQCNSCNDLDINNAKEELYIVVTTKGRCIRYIGMSGDYWSNRPTGKHNNDYMERLSKYPQSYTIYRFKCNNAGLLERAGLELIKKNTSVWNRSWDNGFELLDESLKTIDMLCVTYNLKINVSSKEA